MLQCVCCYATGVLYWSLLCGVGWGRAVTLLLIRTETRCYTADLLCHAWDVLCCYDDLSDSNLDVSSRFLSEIKRINHKSSQVVGQTQPASYVEDWGRKLKQINATCSFKIMNLWWWTTPAGKPHCFFANCVCEAIGQLRPAGANLIIISAGWPSLVYPGVWAHNLERYPGRQGLRLYGLIKPGATLETLEGFGKTGFQMFPTLGNLYSQFLVVWTLICVVSHVRCVASSASLQYSRSCTHELGIQHLQMEMDNNWDKISIDNYSNVDWFKGK